MKVILITLLFFAFSSCDKPNNVEVIDGVEIIPEKKLCNHYLYSDTAYYYFRNINEVEKSISEKYLKSISSYLNHINLIKKKEFSDTLSIHLSGARSKRIKQILDERKLLVNKYAPTTFRIKTPPEYPGYDLWKIPPDTIDIEIPKVIIRKSQYEVEYTGLERKIYHHNPLGMIHSFTSRYPISVIKGTTGFCVMGIKNVHFGEHIIPLEKKSF